MKSLFYPAILLAGLLVVMLGCHSHDHPHDHGHPHSQGGHAHNDNTHAPDELEPLSFTIWTELSELFVEFPPLVVGVTSSFAAHFSNMKNFKAIEVGQAMVCLIENNKEIEVDAAAAPASPGIFRLGLTPAKVGSFNLAFILNTPTIKDTIFIENIPVYANQKEALAAQTVPSGGNEISFLKEQAWKIDFAIEQARRKDIYDIIRTSGEILPIKGEETMLSTKTSGIVFFKSKSLMEGREVRAGETLFSVSSKGLTEENLEEQYQIAKARLERAQANFERSKALLEEKVIAQVEFDE